MQIESFNLEEFYFAPPKNRAASDISGLRKYINSFESVIIWENGRLGIDVCSTLLSLGIRIDLIWDKTPSISSAFSIPVTKPYKCGAHAQNLIIVCVGGESAETIVNELADKSYSNIIRGLDLITSIRNPYNSTDKYSTFEKTTKEELFKYQSLDGRIMVAPQNQQLYVLTDTTTLNVPDDAIVINNLDKLTDEDIRNSAFLIYFRSDSDALAPLKRIRRAGGKFIPHIDPLWRKTHYRFVDRNARVAMEQTWAQHQRVSHLIPEVHENICEALALTTKIPGDYVEIGVYLGGSALTALNYLDLIQCKNKSVWLFDTYNGFTYSESAESHDPIWANTHQLLGPKETISYIMQTLGTKATKFHLIEANICKYEINEEVKNISVANIDVDMYEPTLIALHKVSKLIPKGGIIIAEDPASTPGTYGAYLAMHEFLESQSGRRFMPIFKRGSYFLIAMSALNTKTYDQNPSEIQIDS